MECLVVDDYAVNGKRSLDRVQDAFGQLREFFAGWKASHITPDALTRYTRARPEGALPNKRKTPTPAKPGTVNRELAYLRRAFHLALDAGVVAAIPKFRLLRENNVRTGFFERPDLNILLVKSPPYVRPVYEGAYLTGWRSKSELLTRTWANIDFENGWLRLEPGETKNEQGREFPLTPQWRALFESQYGKAKQIERTTGRRMPWIFFHDDGARIKDFRIAWRNACRRAGLTSRTPHDSRRSAVRNLERSGVPRSAAMKMTGQLTESVYRRYAIVDAGMLRDAATKLAAFHAAESHVLEAPHADIDPLRPEANGQSIVKVSLTEKSGAPSLN